METSGIATARTTAATAVMATAATEATAVMATAATATAAIATAATTTPAGGQINCDWENLAPAIDAFAAFCAKQRGDEPYIVFRCGTTVRADSGCEEFKGYNHSSYSFPGGDRKYAHTIKLIMADNCRVWEAQKSLGGRSVSRAIRQGYALLVRQGYPYPGPDAVRWGQRTESSLLLVHWPALDSRASVFNLAIGTDVEQLVLAAGDLRRSDYMFPEVAAVIMPAKEPAAKKRVVVWSYAKIASDSGTQFEPRSY